jgi:hypothetical protein
MFGSAQISLKIRLILVPVWFDTKVHAAAHYLLQRDARRFVLLRIDVDSGRRATLQLLAALCGEDDQTVLRINYMPLASFNVRL